MTLSALERVCAVCTYTHSLLIGRPKHFCVTWFLSLPSDQPPLLDSSILRHWQLFSATPKLRTSSISDDINLLESTLWIIRISLVALWEGRVCPCLKWATLKWESGSCRFRDHVALQPRPIQEEKSQEGEVKSPQLCHDSVMLSPSRCFFSSHFRRLWSRFTTSLWQKNPSSLPGPQWASQTNAGFQKEKVT